MGPSSGCAFHSFMETQEGYWTNHHSYPCNFNDLWRRFSVVGFTLYLISISAWTEKLSRGCALRDMCCCFSPSQTLFRICGCYCCCNSCLPSSLCRCPCVAERRFIGIPDVSRRGQHPVLVYRVPGEDLCYSFALHRVNRSCQVYRCVSCKATANVYTKVTVRHHPSLLFLIWLLREPVSYIPFLQLRSYVCTRESGCWTRFSFNMSGTVIR